MERSTIIFTILCLFLVTSINTVATLKDDTTRSIVTR